MQCDDGMLFVTTRIPRPGRGFQDYRAYWDSEMGENRVTINEDVGNFIFAHVFPVGYTDPNCTVTMSTINGPTTTGWWREVIGVGRVGDEKEKRG